MASVLSAFILIQSMATGGQPIDEGREMYDIEEEDENLIQDDDPLVAGMRSINLQTEY